MKRILMILLALLIGQILPLSAHQLTGQATMEGRFFPGKPLLGEQEKSNGSFSLQPEYYHEFPRGSSLTFTPFLRWDSSDNRRSHGDIRELNFLWLQENWEVRIGIGKVFWGVTEFNHLVDIINQTDSIESIDGEDKLGQPMVHLSLPGERGILDLFLLPYFRERTFPGKKGRLRAPLVVEQSLTRYESDDKERHVDLALRYSLTLGDWEVALSHFKGTGREPTLLLETSPGSSPHLIPFYEQIDQSGLELQLVAGNWLIKSEGFYRIGQGEEFWAGTGGFEYTLVGLADTALDLGILAEAAYNERGVKGAPQADRELMAGARLVLNDLAGTEILAGYSQDWDKGSRSLLLESSRRLGEQWRITLEGAFFPEISKEDPAYFLRDDDFIRMELAYYF